MATLLRGSVKGSPNRFHLNQLSRQPSRLTQFQDGLEIGKKCSNTFVPACVGILFLSLRTKVSRPLWLVTRGCGSVSVIDVDSFPWAYGVDAEVPLSPRYLANELATCLVNAGKAAEHTEAMPLAHELLNNLSKEFGYILALGSKDRAGRLDGLMDLSSPEGNPSRELRRRLHQALDNMVRWFAHDPVTHLADFSVADARRFAARAVIRKRQLRSLCQSSVAFSTIPPSLTGGEEASVDAAAVHGLKEWCFETIRHYFLLDRDLRTKWLTGKREERFRVTVLTHPLRRLVEERHGQSLPRLSEDDWVVAVCEAAERVLVDRPRILDVGSCTNYFGQHHGDVLEVTAVDLAPGHSSVLACDFLELPVGPPDSVEMEGPLGGLPARHFDGIVMALFFSVLPSPQARGVATAKARQLLKDSGQGLLIVADTKGTVGLHSNEAARKSEWVAAVEANGFKLASDPQLHLSQEQVKGRNGYWQRAFCWSFWTDSSQEVPSKPVPIPVISDTRKHRTLSPERVLARRLREEKRQARARKAALLKAAKAKCGAAPCAGKVNCFPGSSLRSAFDGISIGIVFSSQMMATQLKRLNC